MTCNSNFVSFVVICAIQIIVFIYIKLVVDNMKRSIYVLISHVTIFAWWYPVYDSAYLCSSEGCVVLSSSTWSGIIQNFCISQTIYYTLNQTTERWNWTHAVVKCWIHMQRRSPSIKQLERNKDRWKESVIIISFFIVYWSVIIAPFAE